VCSALAYGLIKFKEDSDDEARALHPELRHCVSDGDWGTALRLVSTLI
jgi:hypothetical protein